MRVAIEINHDLIDAFIETLRELGYRLVSDARHPLAFSLGEFVEHYLSGLYRS